MKMISIAGAALIAASALLPSAASAQGRVVVHERTVVHQERRAGNAHRRTVCDWQRRGPRRVRVCRTVRY